MVPNVLARRSVYCAYFLCWLALATGVPGRAVASQPFGIIDYFNYPNDISAQRAWVARGDSKPVAVLPRGRPGVVFSCNFERPSDRFYWDHAVSMDLTRPTSFLLDFTCDRPRAIRQLGLYLKSGDGWYVCNKTLRDSGRQQVRFLKSEFATEGHPAGWHQIDAIRLSPWRGDAVKTDLTLHLISSSVDNITLVQGTSSIGRSDERAFAKRVTARASKWLDALQIPHGIVTDGDVANGALENASVAILTYNPLLPDKELQALQRFVRRGGKLIVFYSSDQRLADLMGMRLGDYMHAEEAGQWMSFVFTKPEAWHVPDRVFQQSWNIRPVYPKDRSATTLAYWEDARGKRTAHPAWVASDKGAWMSHVLLDDDSLRKQHMLLGILGHYESSIWPAAARASLSQAGRIDSFGGLNEAMDAIAARGQDQRDVRRLLKQAERIYSRMLSAYEDADYPDVVDGGHQLRDTLTEAFSLVQTARKDEFRGVWDHDGVGWYPGNWPRTCKYLADHGMTAIFPNMLWPHVAHYPSEVLPRSNTVRSFGDQVKQCTEAAHRFGLEVHIWKVCWNLSSAPPELIEQMRKQNRLQVDAQGNTLPWLDPSLSQNVTLEIESMKEVVRNYKVDGIHLDYVRYPGSHSSFSDASRASFERWAKLRVSHWPKDVQKGGPYYKQFIEWRATQITRYVERVSRELKSIQPSLKISAAVYGGYPDCITSIGQDWGTWIRKGYVDFVTPMNYTEDPARFRALVNKQLQLASGRTRVLPGIGVTASESQLTPAATIEQIRTLREAGARGFMLFDLSSTLRDHTLPALSRGVTRPAGR